MRREGVKVLQQSSLYKTQPVDVPDQPCFLNAAAEIETENSPQSVLHLVKAIEHKMGRRGSKSKEPRIIDIDIILAGETIVKTQELEIPHPRMTLRNFVLIPLREICPQAMHPLLKKTVKTLAAESADTSCVRRLKD